MTYSRNNSRTEPARSYPEDSNREEHNTTSRYDPPPVESEDNPAREGVPEPSSFRATIAPQNYSKSFYQIPLTKKRRTRRNQQTKRQLKKKRVRQLWERKFDQICEIRAQTIAREHRGLESFEFNHLKLFSPTDPLSFINLSPYLPQQSFVQRQVDHHREK